MRDLTKAEEQVMQILWKLKKGFVKDVLAEFDEPKPAYNTISTIIRILESKGFIGYEAFGKTHCYFPLVSKEDYSKYAANNLMNGYFGGSLQKMLSFFAKERSLNMNELNEILAEIKKQENENN